MRKRPRITFYQVALYKTAYCNVYQFIHDHAHRAASYIYGDL